MTEAMTRFIAYADGASRGNPGSAAYGVVLMDAQTGAVVAQIGEPIGHATNNVAEYRGLLAALERVRDLDPTAHVVVRMDSKLVVEQMTGRWAIKHPDMRDLALRAKAVLPVSQVTYEWIERAKNSAADALANEALDVGRIIDRVPGGDTAGDYLVVPADPRPLLRGTQPPGLPGWSYTGEPTLVTLVRHGVTASTVAKRFSGTNGSDLPLVDLGVEQAQAAGSQIAARGGADLIVASPLLRTLQTASHIAAALGLDPDATVVHDGFRETDFGRWDGLTWQEAKDADPVLIEEWLGRPHIAPPGGESYEQTHERVGEAMRDLLHEHAGRRIVVVTHVTPVKSLVLHAVGAPLEAMYRMEVRPCSLTTLAWFPDGNTSMRGFSETAHLAHLS
ncbi:MAG: bifunctional RNase H/acid phosphatase [Actinomycetales bacterium]|nr:bifunctional RNase H/acid phosphatase [Actinomycetales bacterium]